MIAQNHKRYLGDGVYAFVDKLGRAWLTTEDGIDTTNAICLEPEVLQAFDKWRSQLATVVDSEKPLL